METISAKGLDRVGGDGLFRYASTGLRISAMQVLLVEDDEGIASRAAISSCWT
jgi:hypothetical protein